MIAVMGAGAATMGRGLDLPAAASLSILLFAAPAYWATITGLGGKRGSLLLLLLGVYAIGIESFALATGWPYGKFTYTGSLGVPLPGSVPWTIALAWPPLLLGAVSLARRYFRRATVWIPLAVFVLTAADLVLDPGAVGMGYWQYTDGGFWYGVPFSNYFGWMISGAGGVLLYRTVAGTPHSSMMVEDSYRGYLAFWTGVCLALSFWWAAAIGVFLSILSLMRKT